MRLRAVGADPGTGGVRVTALTLCLIVSGLATAISAGLFFVGAVRSGQMDDLEEVKFRMLREDENR